MGVENRRFERYVFSVNVNISASLILPNGGGSLDARVLNISQGGIGLATERNNREKLEENLDLHLENISGATGFTCLLGKTVQVKWILDYDGLENLGIGCEFLDLDQEDVKAIDYFLRTRDSS